MKSSNFKISGAVLVFILLLISSLSFAQTQAEMNSNALAEYKSKDNELNELYKKIKADYAEDSVFVLNLRASQRLWIKFRDAELMMKYPQDKSYGSALPMCKSMYLMELTEARIKTLKVWIDGIEEGDVCAGSVKSK